MHFHTFYDVFIQMLETTMMMFKLTWRNWRCLWTRLIRKKMQKQKQTDGQIHTLHY